MPLRIRLGRKQIQACLEFSKKCAKSQQAIEFGQSDTAARAIDEITRDNVIGKLGEFAVQQFLADHNIHIKLDLDIYDRGQWDVCDISHNGWNFDIKCYKSRSHWLLIEWSKLQFRSDADQLPHFFVLTRLVDDRFIYDLDDATEFIDVDLVGYIDVRQLRVGSYGVHTLPKGSFIPNTRTPLLAKSFGIKDCDLKSDWKTLIKTISTTSPFSLATYEAPGIAISTSPTTRTPVLDAPNVPHYSLLISGSEVTTPEDLAAMAARGIKLLIFLPETEAIHYQHLNGQAASRIFVTREDVPSIRIYDGLDACKHMQTLQLLATIAPAFNLEQFLVEHAPSDKDIVVKASAGTGKTTVMIDRMIYLFAMDETLMPADIGMITFTNMATASMMEKFQQRIFALYKLTQSARWLEILEGLADLQIATIDSFFKKILQTEGSGLGYGVTAKLRGMAYEKRLLLDEILNDLFKKAPSSLFEHRQLYDRNCVELALDIWEKLRGLGFSSKAVQTADFGSASDSASNTLIAELVRSADKHYDILKHDLNAFAVDDLKMEIAALSNTNNQPLHRRHLRYLFVDEFQDTDNSQIHSIVWLKHAMNAMIFVVGDVKQSIYRFRGAEESAFDELQDQLSRKGYDPAHEFLLVKNYRTAGEILQKLTPIFKSWSTKGFLQWDADTVPCIFGSGSFNIVKINGNLKSTLSPILLDLNQQHRHVCLLVRDNNQVDEIAWLCRELNLRSRAQRRGTFFRNTAVLDFKTLIEALLYPNDNRRLWNLLMSPYVSRRPDPVVVSNFNGDQKALTAYFTTLLNYDGWSDMLNVLRSKPFFSELNRILIKLDPVNRFAEELTALKLTEDETSEQVEHYKINLNKLLKLLFGHFAGEYASLFDVFEYLQVKVATDHTEDELYPEIKEFKGCLFETMTVHKAKGLEFDVVVVPYTNKKFFYEAKDKDITIRSDESTLRVGWHYKNLENDLYQEDISFEQDAVRRDEARLLYVAMTRAKERLIVLTDSVPQDDTWSNFLHKAI